MFNITLIVIIIASLAADTFISDKIKYQQDAAVSSITGAPLTEKIPYLPYEYFTDTTGYQYTNEQGEVWTLIYSTVSKDDSIIQHTEGSFVVEVDSFWVDEVSNALFQAELPVLYNYYFGSEQYRFTWLRSFDPPVVITITRTNSKDKTMLQTTFVDEGKVKTNSKVLTQRQWNDFISLLHQEDFWSQPVYEQRMLINDGSFWTIESHQADGYYVVSRRIPENCFLRDIGEYMINLNSAKDEEIY